MTKDQSPAAVLTSRGWSQVVGTDVRAREIDDRLNDAPLWRIESAQGSYVLRGWKADQLPIARRSHQLLAHFEQHRPGWTPCPLPVNGGTRTLFPSPDGLSWELTPWLPGETNFELSASLIKLQAMCRALAEFHQLAAHFSVDTAAPNGVTTHLQKLDRLSEALASGSFAQVRKCHESLFHTLNTGATFTSQQLTPLASLALPIQLCWGDAWHNNFLFIGDKVSGLIDFATVRADTPAADLARLLGSATAEHSDWRQTGLDAYADIRPLAPAERQAIEALDASGTVLSLANWTRWLLIEQRTFPDPAKADDRLRHFSRRLEKLIADNPTPLGWDKHPE